MKFIQVIVSSDFPISATAGARNKDNSLSILRLCTVVCTIFLFLGKFQNRYGMFKRMFSYVMANPTTFICLSIEDSKYLFSYDIRMSISFLITTDHHTNKLHVVTQKIISRIHMNFLIDIVYLPLQSLRLRDRHCSLQKYTTFCN